MINHKVKSKMHYNMTLKITKMYKAYSCCGNNSKTSLKIPGWERDGV